MPHITLKPTGFFDILYDMGFITGDIWYINEFTFTNGQTDIECGTIADDYVSMDFGVF